MKRYIRSSEYSEIDSEGNAVPEDLSSALKNSKIRNRKGQLIVCYHGTNAEFAEFKEDFISENSGNIGRFGKGFYFTNSKKLAQSYGNNLKKCYLNITRPFVYSDPESIWALYSLGIDPRIYNHRLAPFAYLEDEEPIEVFTDAVKQGGYDGVKFSYRQGQYTSNIPGTGNASEYICFSSNQVYFL